MNQNLGRPKSGKKSFGQDEIMKLPIAATPYRFAKVLGVSRQCFCKWQKQEACPVLKLENGTFSVIRFEFLQWAKQTGRWNGAIY
jgi:hypothetical protein